MTDILVSKDDGQVVTLTLNDAPANCLTMEMMSAIKMEIDRVSKSKDHKLVEKIIRPFYLIRHLLNIR